MSEFQIIEFYCISSYIGLSYWDRSEVLKYTYMYNFVVVYSYPALHYRNTA